MADEKILINPIFGIPAGAEDSFTYSQELLVVPPVGEGTQVESNKEIDTSVNDIIEDDDSAEYASGVSENDESTMDVPTNFDVISQKIRRAPGGQQVVDIIVQSEDIAGAINYEFQVVKL